MARGKSGRVVLEIDPGLKRDLYLELEKKQLTLKSWFVSEVKNLVYTPSNETPEAPNQLIEKAS
jgi:hypothetical protein